MKIKKIDLLKYEINSTYRKIKFVESGRDNAYASQIIIKLKDYENQYVAFKDVSVNRYEDRVKPKSIKGGDVPVVGNYIKMFSCKKI